MTITLAALTIASAASIIATRPRVSTNPSASPMQLHYLLTGLRMAHLIMNPIRRRDRTGSLRRPIQRDRRGARDFNLTLSNRGAAGPTLSSNHRDRDSTKQGGSAMRWRERVCRCPSSRRIRADIVVANETDHEKTIPPRTAIGPVRRRGAAAWARPEVHSGHDVQALR